MSCSLLAGTTLLAPRGCSRILAMCSSILWLFASSWPAGKPLWLRISYLTEGNQESDSPITSLAEKQVRLHPHSREEHNIKMWLLRDKNFWSHLRILTAICTCISMKAVAKSFQIFAQHCISSAWYILSPL